MRLLRGVLVGLVLVVAIAAGWLYFAPPELIRVAANYTAKTVCSNVFIAGRDADEVLAVDVQAPGHPLLKLMNVDVDRASETVRTGLFGLFGGGLAAHQKGRGCTVYPGGKLRVKSDAEVLAVPAKPDAPWPMGEPSSIVAPSENLAAAMRDHAGPGMRAIVVVKDGKLVGEAYGPGFSHETPLTGWSMTKTVTAALIGSLVREGKLSLDQNNLLPEWAGDGRAAIKLADLMGMASDLTWDESYGSVSDVTRMLFLQADMAGFADAQPLDASTPEGIGEAFEYSSGTSVILSRIWQDAAGSADAENYPQTAIFAPLGMKSAVLERDVRGVYVGSSHMYASARDWARFGQFLLQKGVWNGTQILPQGYVDWMVEPHPASNGDYGRGQVWLSPPGARGEKDAIAAPAGTFWIAGHDGQSLAVVPGENLVVVRLGLTPSKHKYQPAALVNAVIEASR